MLRPRIVASDEAAMAQAIDCALSGWPAPNPRVGCVIVANGNVVGRGHCAFVGGPHAEVIALREAGDLARGATAYVTLEPCNHFGRTPPCSRALIEAGIARVVIANLDPNPKAAGGVNALREHGIEVEIGVCERHAAFVNRQFLFAMREQRPLVRVKVAASLDGRTGLTNGKSKWITSPESRLAGHKMRLESGSVLVGRATVEADNPELTARLIELNDQVDMPDPAIGADLVFVQPTRIILDPRGVLNEEFRVFNSAAPTKHVTGPIDLGAFLKDLFSDGIIGVMVEGGPITVSRLIRANLVDEITIHQSPKLLGNGSSWFRDDSLEDIPDIAQFVVLDVCRHGPDTSTTLVVRQRLDDPLWKFGLTN